MLQVSVGLVGVGLLIMICSFLQMGEIPLETGRLIFFLCLSLAWVLFGVELFLGRLDSRKKNSKE